MANICDRLEREMPRPSELKVAPMRAWSWLGLILLVGAAIGVPRAHAQSADDPAAVVVGLVDAMAQVAGDAELSAQDRKQRLGRLLRDRFDLAAIARYALGGYSAGASQQEQNVFAGLFQRWIIEIYAGSMKGFDAAAVKVTGARPDGADDVVVTSELPQSGDGTIKIEWRLHRNDRQYRIIDLSLGGASLMRVEREQIAAVIQQNGGTVAGLNRALEDRLGDDKSGIALSDAH
jgi:phospholipid transport system substrate-binding protein